MASIFDRDGKRGASWQRELAPVIAVAGLAADYLSPPALWTIFLPLGAVVLLLALRRWAPAAAVLLLSSWFLIPATVETVRSIEELRGEPCTLLVGEGEVPPCSQGLPFVRLPIGPGHLLDPHWALRDAVESFTDLHNAMVLDRCLAPSASSARPHDLP